VSRTLAAIISSGAAAMLVVGSLTAIALGHSNPPAASPEIATVAIQTRTGSNTPGKTSTGAGRPLTDPTAAGAAGNAKAIFLSFDDGPDPVWTPEILKTLAKHGAKATFFELGQMIQAHPGLRELVVAGGNTIGNHSITHARLTKVSAARRHHEIFDGPKSRCFRPPYGASSPKVRADIKAAGMTQILWDVDARDWARPGTSAIVQSILNHAKRRNIILMHDGGGNRSQSVAALDKVLPILKARGYSFPAMNC
jgi:peptidoglycan/xylan/chitin deacetylase (PgdA/CDA1 family)